MFVIKVDRFCRVCCCKLRLIWVYLIVSIYLVRVLVLVGLIWVLGGMGMGF